MPAAFRTDRLSRAALSGKPPYKGLVGRAGPWDTNGGGGGMQRTDPEGRGPVRYGPPAPEPGLPVLPELADVFPESAYVAPSAVLCGAVVLGER
ncbi:hypothetical protein AB0M96_36660, partial [Streptomyces sp. NPDC051098]